ncbi:MAG: hypothetical protein WHS44_12940 [Fimbriimonadales bacterium]
MRLHKRLADYRVWFADSGGEPYIDSIEGHRRTGRWYKASDAYYQARMQGLQARTLVAAAANNAHLYAPGAPYHRLRLIVGNGDYTAQGQAAVAGSRRLGDYGQVVQYNLPSNDYIVQDFDAKSIGSGDYYPTVYRVSVFAGGSNPAELGDLRLYAYADLTPLLRDLTPVRTSYEVSAFAPLGESALLGRYLQGRAYQVSLLVARSDESLPWLLSLREGDEVELEYDGVYLPCSVQSAESRPAGGALWEIEYQLVATAAYGYSPLRYVVVHNHSGQGDLHGYEMPGNAPAPVELRLQVTQTHASDIDIHLPASGEVVRIRPDATGIWSLHDTGRIYHIPTGTQAQWIDRTDILKQGALPIVLPSGDGVFALAHSASWGLPQVALAAYPRYMPEVSL